MELYTLFLLSFVLFTAGAAYMLITQAHILAENEGHLKRKRLLLSFLKRFALYAGIVGLRTAYAILAPRVKEVRDHVRSAVSASTQKLQKRFAHVLNLIAGRVTITKGNSSLYLERIHVHKESLQKGAIDYDFSA